MRAQTDLTRVARLDFVGEPSHAAGWYVRYVIDGRPKSERLAIEVGADAFGAVELAASHLGCRAEQITVAGPVWPVPLDGMVNAEETLEFVADPMPGLTDRVGEWCLLSEPIHQNYNVSPTPYKEPRRFDRRTVEGLALHMPFHGKVLNWSEDGMGVEIHRPLRVFSRCLFQAKGKKSKIELFGEVRWCQSVDGISLEGPALYRAGITLIA